MNENKEVRKAPVAILIVFAVLMLLSAGLTVYTFVLVPKTEAKEEPAVPETVVQTATEEASEQNEQLPPRIRSFGGTLEWYDGGKWVGYEEIIKLKESDPVLAALLEKSQAGVGQEEESEEEEPERLVKTVSGNVAEEKKGGASKKNDPSDKTPAPAPPAGSGGGDGQDTDASGL